MSGPPRTLVLGAGCAGLAAAWRLLKRGRRVAVVEAADHVGGLAGGIRVEGNTYEYGPHVFHTTDPEILADIKSLLGAELTSYRRTIQIKFLGNYFQFPLSMADILFKLPPRTVAHAALSFAYHFVAGVLRRPAVESSETLLRRYYGDVLYRLFFRDYITRVWGIPPSQFSPSFARERIPKLDVLELLDKARMLLRARLGRRGALRTEGFVEKLEGNLYTTREGFSLITRRMADRVARSGGEVLLETEVTGIEQQGLRVCGITVRRGDRISMLPCEAVVNTLPINEAALAFRPSLGLQVERSARELRFRAIVFVGIQAARPKVLPATFMYFREHSFNRITDLAHFGFAIRPPGTTLLIAEVTCDSSDRLWTDEALAKEAVAADLLREQILRREEILKMHVFRSRHAYPMYTMGYEKALKTLLEAFSALDNFETAGRQGRFQYVNTHVAMKMGYEAADRLAKRLAWPG
ncbi:MAG: FAD-dependent oxidoreductase [Acidobacteria bacterium]|nr:FAD-dependent oxidoreductase [Acidobacteriota bacterium]